METHTAIWGHVGLTTPSTPAMQEREDASLMVMLRCRYAPKAILKTVSLCGFLPDTGEVVFNPNTLKDLAAIFETDIDKAFA